MTHLLLALLLGGADGGTICRRDGMLAWCDDPVTDNGVRFEVGAPAVCFPDKTVKWCCTDFKCDAKSGTCVWAKCAPEKKP